MMGNKKFYVTGRVVVSRKSMTTGEVRNVTAEFNRTVCASDYRAAIEMVSDSLRKKYTADTRVYTVVDFDVLQIDVYELVHESYDWDAHRKYGLTVVDKNGTV